MDNSMKNLFMLLADNVTDYTPQFKVIFWTLVIISLACVVMCFNHKKFSLNQQDKVADFIAEVVSAVIIGILINMFDKFDLSIFGLLIWAIIILFIFKLGPSFFYKTDTKSSTNRPDKIANLLAKNNVKHFEYQEKSTVTTQHHRWRKAEPKIDKNTVESNINSEMISQFNIENEKMSIFHFWMWK